MALPEAHAEPAVQEGVCYALSAYDAGLAINLDESERRITALTQRAAIRHKRRAPRYFEYRPAPLRVTQEREVLAVGAFRTAPSVDAVLYDFGAVSVTYQIPLARPLTRLITLAEELYESDVLSADAPATPFGPEAPGHDSIRARPVRPDAGGQRRPLQGRQQRTQAAR